MQYQKHYFIFRIVVEMNLLRLNSVSGPIGGVENYIENTDKLLSERGFDILTVTLRGEDSFFE